jgi:hypothetical protein
MTLADPKDPVKDPEEVRIQKSVQPLIYSDNAELPNADVMFLGFGVADSLKLALVSQAH